LTIDPTLLKNNMTMEQFLTFNALQADQYQLIHNPINENSYEVLSLKDSILVGRVINAFLDMSNNKMHVTSISTEDSMVVNLSN